MFRMGLALGIFFFIIGMVLAIITETFMYVVYGFVGTVVAIAVSAFLQDSKLGCGGI